MEVITKDMEEVKAYFEALERGTKYVDNVTANFHPVMNGEVYLTGEDVCRILHITTRTLQDYRAQRIIPFIALPGKTLYRQSDLLRMLEENYVQMKQKSKGKALLNFWVRCMGKCGKGRNFQTELLPLPCFALPRRNQAVSRMATACCLLTFFCFLSRTFFCMAARLPEIERKSELTILLVTSAYICVVLICL